MTFTFKNSPLPTLSVIADGLVKIGLGLGIGYAGLFGAVYLATFLISNIVTNNAAAGKSKLMKQCSCCPQALPDAHLCYFLRQTALMFPIAMEAAETTGADKLLMSYDLMLAASASFMSPYGYQTNLLIYGPGGYKTKDFLYIGTPMQLILWILTTVILSNTTAPWWLSWIWTFGVFLLVCLIFVFPYYVKRAFNKAKHASQHMTEIDLSLPK